MLTPFIILNIEHARSDDVLHIFQVNSEGYQTQKGATKLTFMFCTYKLWTPVKNRMECKWKRGQKEKRRQECLARIAR
jgi:hypothetical protein